MERINPGYEEYLKGKKGQPFRLEVIVKHSPVLSDNLQTIQQRDERLEVNNNE